LPDKCDGFGGRTKNSNFDTESPYRFSFDETDRGKALYVSPCGKTPREIKTRGEKLQRRLYHRLKTLLKFIKIIKKMA
jgi:hypothetical protein